MKYLLCAGCFAGNMGGDAMYETVIEEIKKSKEDEFTILVKYPKDEIPICNKRKYRCVRFTTIDRVLLTIPFFVFGSALKKLHIPYKWLAKGALKEYVNNDVLLDFSGISFTDYRGILDLVINTTWLLPAFVTGIKTIKMPQSLGPYNRMPVKRTAKFALGRVDCIMARGDKSYSNTKKLLPQKDEIYNMPDIAMNLPPSSENERRGILESAGIPYNQEYICIAPSIVVDERFGHDEYCKIISSIVSYICKHTKYNIIFTPHTQSLSKAAGVDYISDDLNVCKSVYEQNLINEDRMYILSDRLDSHQLKAIIGKSYIAIGSRYHFLIASMSSGIPSMALGWGDKYSEMFSLFGMEKYVFEYHDFKIESIIERTKTLFAERDSIYKTINEKLSDIKRESAESMKIVRKILTEN